MHKPYIPVIKGTKKLLHFSTPHYKYLVYGTKDLLLSPLTIIKHPILDMIFLITYQNKALLFMKTRLHTQD